MPHSEAQQYDILCQRSGSTKVRSHALTMTSICVVQYRHSESAAKPIE